MPDPDKLQTLMRAKQGVLLAGVGLVDSVGHPTTKGDITEAQWAGVLGEFLPSRYEVSQRSHLVDCNGRESENIDIIIHDGHYCPLLFEADNRRFIPAEGVYAIFEVKQNLNKAHVKTAGKSAKTMRRMKRTNAEIVHAGGVTKPKTPFRQLAGILTTNSDWSPPFGKPFKSVLSDLPKDGQLDIGCSLKDGAFVIDSGGKKTKLEISDPDASLVVFLMELYTKLQALGTVPAIDLREYARPALKKDA